MNKRSDHVESEEVEGMAGVLWREFRPHIYAKRFANPLAEFIVGLLHKARKDEREACAKVAEAQKVAIPHFMGKVEAGEAKYYNDQCEMLAGAIRRRGEG